jgi:hypothetical protein
MTEVQGMYAPPGAEDPISAIFELSDRAAEMGRTVRRMYRYTATVVVLFLIIMVFLLFVGLATNLFFSLLALVALIFGGIALSLLRETDRFYGTFVERHRAIKLLQDAEPTPKIPAGRTPLERLARYLAQSNPAIGEFLKAHPDALRYQVQLDARGPAVVVDLAIIAPGSTSHRWFGWGDPGFAVLARVGPDAPAVADVDRFAQEVVRVARRLPGRLRRAILLRVHPVPIPEAVYEYAVGHPIDLPGGPVPVELIGEEANGTYDLVPHVLGVP